MDLKTFTDLTSKMIAYRAVLASVEESIPAAAIRNEWYRFSTQTRCEYGAQGVPAGFDTTRANALPFAVQFLVGVVPVDFLFPESRETAKDAYRALCAEIGDPTLAAEQMAEHESMQTVLDSATARERSEWLALAEQAGLPVPEIPVEVFASMTRAEFDSAVIVVDEYRATMGTFTSAVKPSVVEAWMAFQAGVQSEFGVDASFYVGTQGLDWEILGAPAAEAAHTLITNVPLGFLVEETCEQFKDEYRTYFTDAVEMMRDEDEHKRLMVESERKEAARREFVALGQRLGFVSKNNTVII